jgi:hypothetical protein
MIEVGMSQFVIDNMPQHVVSTKAMPFRCCIGIGDVDVEDAFAVVAFHSAVETHAGLIILEFIGAVGNQDQRSHLSHPGQGKMIGPESLCIGHIVIKIDLKIGVNIARLLTAVIRTLDGYPKVPFHLIEVLLPRAPAG